MFSVRRLLNIQTLEADTLFVSESLHEVLDALKQCREKYPDVTFFLSVAPYVEEEN